MPNCALLTGLVLALSSEPSPCPNPPFGFSNAGMGGGAVVESDAGALSRDLLVSLGQAPVTDLHIPKRFCCCSACHQMNSKLWAMKSTGESIFQPLKFNTQDDS